jgi:hypothetical protein
VCLPFLFFCLSERYIHQALLLHFNLKYKKKNEKREQEQTRDDRIEGIRILLPHSLLQLATKEKKQDKRVKRYPCQSIALLCRLRQSLFTHAPLFPCPLLPLRLSFPFTFNPLDTFLSALYISS